MTKAAESILDGLDSAQRAAASSLNGPVRIIAGAGAGKTRTITRRIAYACASGRWEPKKVLAVTFSVKAAQEMRDRLTQLGVPEEVRASTFHSAALSQLYLVWNMICDDPLPEIVDDSRTLVQQAILRALNREDMQARDIRDITEEISWCKVSLVAPDDYARVCSATHREPPALLEVDDFASVYEEYEKEKAARQQIDFNDILLLVCHILEDFPKAARRIRSQIGWLTVDEYQDVSPLQHRLMKLWLDGNSNICVVGDPAQTIYSFAGATSYYLTHFAQEFPDITADIRLDTDYRSIPTIVRAANRVILASPDADDYLKLHSGREGRAKIMTMVHETDLREADFIARDIAAAIEKGHKPGDFAILTRLRSQQPLFARQLAEQQLRYRIRKDNGWQQSEIFADAAQNKDLEIEDLGAVTISTIHASKGLEFKHVYVIGCSEGLIPYASPGEGPELEEERRMLYVALTRAEDTLHLSYAYKADSQSAGVRERSRFLS